MKPVYSRKQIAGKAVLDMFYEQGRYAGWQNLGYLTIFGLMVDGHFQCQRLHYCRLLAEMIHLQCCCCSDLS